MHKTELLEMRKGAKEEIDQLSSLGQLAPLVGSAKFSFSSCVYVLK